MVSKISEEIIARRGARPESGPETAFLVLDTESRPDLVPANPPAQVLIAAQDAAFLFDPQLQVTRPPRPKRPRALIPSGPVRLRR